MARRPTQLKLLDGTANTTRLNPAEPKIEPLVKVPPPPGHLTKEEKAAWTMFATEICALRIMSPRDLPALEMLARKWALYQHLQKKLRKGNDVTYETTNAAGSKMVRVRPEVSLLNGVEHKILELIGRFGLTPADRQRVSVIKRGRKGSSGESSSEPEDEFT